MITDVVEYVGIMLHECAIRKGVILSLDNAVLAVKFHGSEMDWSLFGVTDRAFVVKHRPQNKRRKKLLSTFPKQ